MLNYVYWQKSYPDFQTTSVQPSFEKQTAAIKKREKVDDLLSLVGVLHFVTS